MDTIRKYIAVLCRVLERMPPAHAPGAILQLLNVAMEKVSVERPNHSHWNLAQTKPHQEEVVLYTSEWQGHHAKLSKVISLLKTSKRTTQ